MDTIGILIRDIIDDVKTLEWNTYLIMDLFKLIKEKIEVAMDHGDTWRLWGPHKLEFLCHMVSSSCNFESMGILIFLDELKG